jgi:hypothetical protein
MLAALRRDLSRRGRSHPSSNREVAGTRYLWLTKSSEHQVIATEPEQAGAGSRARGRPVSRPGGLFLMASLLAGREAVRDGLKI